MTAPLIEIKLNRFDGLCADTVFDADGERSDV